MRLPAAAVLLALFVGAAATGAFLLVQSPGGRESDVAVAALVDESGEPLRRVDGSEFPPGSRRERDRVITPDGTAWTLETDGWTRAPEAGRSTRSGRSGTAASDGTGRTASAGGRRRVDSRARSGTEAGTDERTGDAAENGARGPSRDGPAISAPIGVAPPPGETAALNPLDVRPALGDSNTVTVAFDPDAALPKDWVKSDATLTSSPTRRARTDVFHRPEAADGARRDHVDEQRALDEHEAVVAQHGLRADYYDLVNGDLREIPDVSGATPTFSRIDLSIDFDIDDAFALPFEPETFAVRWSGFLQVPEAGEYTFTCGSDDGMTIRIGDVPVVNYARLRPYAETEGSVTLEAGRHPVEIIFYENRVYAAARLFWAGPSWSKRIIESRFFSPPTALSGVIQPHVTRIEPPAARLGETVTLSGVGFSPTPQLNRVTFAGVAGEIVEASASHLVVKVPLGAETGDVTARVGELTSLPRKFTVDSVTGLFAEYFLIGQDLGVMPDLDVLTPYFVRLDGPLDYHQDLLWSLPYEPDVFAARYRGLLWVPEEDDYRVTLGSDDGAFVVLDGEQYLGAPGLHAYRETTRTSHFTRGFHPIEVTFFENRGVARLRLFWQRPSDVERRPIPRGFLFPPEELTAAPAPVLTSAPPGAVGDVITITGSGFGSEPGLARVEFPGGVWARPETVADSQLTVRVPYTTGTGDLRVSVGIRSSNATQFVRTTPVGLTADYFVFSSEEELRAATLETLAEKTPNRTRVDTSWRLEKSRDWNAPFPMKNVVVHWHGTLGIDEAVDLSWILQADDGAHLFVNGQHVLDNGPFHGLQERFGRSVLQPGEHTIDIWYYQADRDAKFHLFWNPWGLRDHREVPARWFQPSKPAGDNSE